MDCSHHSFCYTKVVFEDLHNGSNAVGGARSITNNGVGGVESLFINANDNGFDLVAFSGSRYDDFFSAS